MSSIMSLLGGGGPQAPQGQGGPPPGVAPSIQIGGAPGAQGPSGGSGDWETDLRTAIADLRKLTAEATDDQEAAIVAQCMTALQKLLGTRQGQNEGAAGTTPALKAMGRAY